MQKKRLIILMLLFIILITPGFAKEEIINENITKETKLEKEVTKKEAEDSTLLEAKEADKISEATNEAEESTKVKNEAILTKEEIVKKDQEEVNKETIDTLGESKIKEAKDLTLLEVKEADKSIEAINEAEESTKVKNEAILTKEEIVKKDQEETLKDSKENLTRNTQRTQKNQELTTNSATKKNIDLEKEIEKTPKETTKLELKKEDLSISVLSRANNPIPSNSKITKISLGNIGHFWSKYPEQTAWESGTISKFIEESTGQVGFCLDEHLAPPSGNVTQVDIANKFTEEIRKITERIVYFGYYNKDKTDKMFAFTQRYIWEDIIKNKNIRFRWADAITSSPDTNRENEYNQWKENVVNEVTNYPKVKPNFGVETINLKVGESITLTDTTAQLSLTHPNGSYVWNLVNTNSDVLEVIRNGNDITLTAKLNAVNSSKIIFFEYNHGNYKGISFAYGKGGLSEDGKSYQDVGFFNVRDPINSRVLVNIKEEPTVDFKLKKVNEKGENLEGVVFDIASDKAFKNIILKGAVTNSLGEIDIKGIKFRDIKALYIKEVKTLPDYVNDKGLHRVALEAGKTALIKLTNKPERVDFKLKKVNEKGENLEGVVFDIASDKAFKNIILKGAVTNSLGEIDIKGIKFRDIKALYIKETKTLKGYVIDKEIKKVDLIKGEISKVVFKNEPIIGELEITKTDISTGELIPNVLFEVYSIDNKLLFSSRTNEKGVVIFKNLKFGKYYFLEKEAPEGYILNDEKHYFEIKTNGEIIKSKIGNLKQLPFTGSDNNLITTISISSILSGIIFLILARKKHKSIL